MVSATASLEGSNCQPTRSKPAAQVLRHMPAGSEFVGRRERTTTKLASTMSYSEGAVKRRWKVGRERSHSFLLVPLAPPTPPTPRFFLQQTYQRTDGTTCGNGRDGTCACVAGDSAAGGQGSEEEGCVVGHCCCLLCVLGLGFGDV